MSELFNVFKAMEYNDREETLYSIIRNVKKANIFQEKAVQIERPRYYHVGDKRQLLIEHRNEHLNTVYHELKSLMTFLCLSIRKSFLNFRLWSLDHIRRIVPILCSA